MPKQYTIFSIEKNDTVINYEVDKAKSIKFWHDTKKINSGFDKVTTIKTKQ